MYKILVASLLCLCLTNCDSNKNAGPNPELKKLFHNYWEAYLKLHPFSATSAGDNRYNDLFPNDQTASYRAQDLQLANDYLLQLEKFSTSNLNSADAESVALLKYELQQVQDKYKLPLHLMPINQFWSFTLEFAQLGSGTGNQPFKTVKDYDNWMARAKQFPAWTDSCIANMRAGIASGILLPKVLVEKMIPQAKSMSNTDPTKSIFYEPIKNIPTTFSDTDKARLKNVYFYNISNTIMPAYARLRKFLETEYLPAARVTHGLGALPQGKDMYSHLIQRYTTTNLKPDSIYNLGLEQVALLRREMEKVKEQVQFKGDLPAFFEYMNKDRSFYPFKTAAQVIDSFARVQKAITPSLAKMFKETPKTKFEIRQTEAFRAATASAEYNNGSEDGTRPGIFYVPILDATNFNTVGMETLFLHEAIPGHHYQISLQQENKQLPQFRKFTGYSAYAEGWALYTETLGKELGVFQNPYQYFGHLSDAMHRAIRLVVDAGMHAKGMTREEAIKYMMANERITEPEAIAEIERYMAIPGQALSYKIGKLTILKMRDKYQKQLGSKFSLPEFHHQILNGGNMPLSLLEKKLQSAFD
jgi:uncharacterized protein (DUF885 family)